MNTSRPIEIWGRDGVLGVIDPSIQPNDEVEVLIRLNDGKLIQVPADLIVPQEDGSYYLPMSQDQFNVQEPAAGAQTLMVIPVMVEQLEVDRKRITRGRVRVHKKVTEREEVVDESGFHEEVIVDRVPINQVVETAPQVHYEGNILVIPILEEVLVVEKRLVFKEEVRIRKQRTEMRNPQHVTLRSEDVEIERDNPTEMSTKP